VIKVKDKTKDFEQEKNIKNVTKRKNSKWRLYPRWWRKCFFQFKIFKLTIFQKLKIMTGLN
jgi:hypothetical protein